MPYVPRYLLMLCDQSGQRIGAAVIDSSLPQVQVRAAAEGLDPDLTIREVHELDAESAALIPTAAIGHVLNREEIAALIRQIGGNIRKRPDRQFAATSISFTSSRRPLS